MSGDGAAAGPRIHPHPPDPAVPVEASRPPVEANLHIYPEWLFRMRVTIPALTSADIR